MVNRKYETENFLKPDSPRFEAAYAGKPPLFNGELKVISWNIKYADKVDIAIAELMDKAELRDAEILLLQEMDESGVEKIANKLLYNYIYYPASVSRMHGRLFGNAVLSKWPISGSAKLLLPHLSPRTGECRIATRAHLHVAGHDLLTYSVHTETFALESKKRHQQFQALADDIRGEVHRHVLVGGDFNTVRIKDIRMLESWFAEAGLTRVSMGAEPTQKTALMRFSLDHIFTRGMASIEKDVWRGTRASDHFPVWQRFSLL